MVKSKLLFKNYDLYETPGVDGKAKQGPGTGFYQNMGDYKSIADFLKKKRKEKSDKNKADKSKKDKKARRQALLQIFIKTAIDFPIDDQISNPILGDAGAYSDSVPIGGMLDKFLPENDSEGKSAEQLDFAGDSIDPEVSTDVDSIINKFLNPQENSLYGLPDGINPQSDLDADQTISNRNSDYGTTDSGNTLYDKISY